MPIIELLKKFLRKPSKSPDGYYDHVCLTADDIAKQAYKQHLGGGEETWKSRGAFQLYFLKRMGLLPTQSFLDVGCGPIRGGEHLIPYLDKGLYCGFDYNRDFILAAKEILAQNQSLTEKDPLVLEIADFDMSGLSRKFDYSLAFSVLNHCNPAQRNQFFTELPRVIKKGTKTYVTHGAWFTPAELAGTMLKLSSRFDHPEEIDKDLRMKEWGWPAGETIFPILELKLSDA